MHIVAACRSIAFVACGLPALAQAAGGDLVGDPLGGGDPCILITGMTQGTWVDASAQKPGLLQGELIDRSGARYAMDAQLLVGLLAAPVGAQSGALVGDLYDLAAGAGAEPFAVLIGVWSRDSSVGGSFQAQILDPASPIFAPIELGQVAGSFGVTSSSAQPSMAGSALAGGGASQGGLVSDGGAIIVDYLPGHEPSDLGRGPAKEPHGDLQGSPQPQGSDGVILIDVQATYVAPGTFGFGAASAPAHAGQLLSGSATQPLAGAFDGHWSLCL